MAFKLDLGYKGKTYHVESSSEALVGKKVVVTGTLQHIRGRSKLYPLISDSHAMFVELKGVSVAQ